MGGRVALAPEFLEGKAEPLDLYSRHRVAQLLFTVGRWKDHAAYKLWGCSTEASAM